MTRRQEESVEVVHGSQVFLWCPLCRGGLAPHAQASDDFTLQVGEGGPGRLGHCLPSQPWTQTWGPGPCTASLVSVSEAPAPRPSDLGFLSPSLWCRRHLLPFLLISPPHRCLRSKLCSQGPCCSLLCYENVKKTV